MTTQGFDFTAVHPSWLPAIEKGLSYLDKNYLKHLYQDEDWLPGKQRIFNAFSLPIHQVNYLLLGESPYPRPESANGYAFWDAAVHELWSPTGLSKKVNRATSLRNMIKMLLIAEDMLDAKHLNQSAIASINKQSLVQTNQAFFSNFIHHGFLLLNASLVLQTRPAKQDAQAWQPFMAYIFHYLLEQRPHTKLLLWGRIAHEIQPLLKDIPGKIEKLCAEHPYNLSFITRPDVLDFFRPLHLLRPANLAAKN